MSNNQDKKLKALEHNIKYKAQQRMKARADEMNKEIEKIKSVSQVIEENS